MVCKVIKMNNLTNLFNELTTSYAEFDAKQNKKNSAKVRKYLMNIKKECGHMRKSVLNVVKVEQPAPVVPVVQVVQVAPVEPVAAEPVETVPESTPAHVKKEKKDKKKRKIEKIEKKTTIKFN